MYQDVTMRTVTCQTIATNTQREFKMKKNTVCHLSKCILLYFFVYLYHYDIYIYERRPKYNLTTSK